MTDTAAAHVHGVGREVAGSTGLGAAWDRLSREGVRYAAARADSWTRQLKGVAEPAGATDQAVVEGVKAVATDGNPVLAAVKGAWAGADGKSKVAIVAALVLLVVLAPVLLLLILLGVGITVLVLRVRAAKTRSSP